jgi:uncharacterized DUF497 family protein
MRTGELHSVLSTLARCICRLAVERSEALRVISLREANRREVRDYEETQSD